MTGAAATSYEQAGVKGLAQAALAEPARRAARSTTSPIADAYARGAAYGLRATSKEAGSGGPEGGDAGSPGTPGWANSMARANQIRAAGFVAAQAVSSGDRPAQSSGPSLSDKS
jgi:hypothetical protein